MHTPELTQAPGRHLPCLCPQVHAPSPDSTATSHLLLTFICVHERTHLPTGFPLCTRHSLPAEPSLPHLFLCQKSRASEELLPIPSWMDERARGRCSPPPLSYCDSGCHQVGDSRAQHRAVAKGDTQGEENQDCAKFPQPSLSHSGVGRVEHRGGEHLAQDHRASKRL